MSRTKAGDKKVHDQVWAFLQDHDVLPHTLASIDLMPLVIHYPTTQFGPQEPEEQQTLRTGTSYSEHRVPALLTYKARGWGSMNVSMLRYSAMYYEPITAALTDFGLQPIGWEVPISYSGKPRYVGDLSHTEIKSNSFQGWGKPGLYKEPSPYALPDLSDESARIYRRNALYHATLYAQNDLTNTLMMLAQSNLVTETSLVLDAATIVLDELRLEGKHGVDSYWTDLALANRRSYSAFRDGSESDPDAILRSNVVIVLTTRTPGDIRRTAQRIRYRRGLDTYPEVEE
jgi:hypothetical protein